MDKKEKLTLHVDKYEYIKNDSIQGTVYDIDKTYDVKTEYHSFHLYIPELGSSKAGNKSITLDILTHELERSNSVLYFKYLIEARLMDTICCIFESVGLDYDPKSDDYYLNTENIILEMFIFILRSTCLEGICR